MQPQSIPDKPLIDLRCDNGHGQAGVESGRSGKIEHRLWLLTIILLAGGWVAGFYLENADIEAYLYQAMPTAELIEKGADGSYVAHARSGQILGYVTIGEGDGYGGPMNLAVASDLEGTITGLAVVHHRETPSWFTRVQENDFFSRLTGKRYSDPFTLGHDIDTISGATYTSRALVEASRDGIRHLAENDLHLAVSPQVVSEIQFGLPEIALLALFVLGFIGRRKGLRHKNSLRWFCMLSGMVLLGFVYTTPLTISFINKLLLGFWPDWHTHLYWYLLFGTILFSLTATGNNPYCDRLCPFGAAQECIGKIGGAKVHAISRYRAPLKWLQRCLALTAILIALIYRNPGISSYEIFGTLFDLQGTLSQFFLLGMVILVSLFVHRPWCRFLCPLKPLEAFLRTIRTWVKNQWNTKKTEPVR